VSYLVPPHSGCRRPAALGVRLGGASVLLDSDIQCFDNGGGGAIDQIGAEVVPESSRPRGWCARWAALPVFYWMRTLAPMDGRCRSLAGCAPRGGDHTVRPTYFGSLFASAGVVPEFCIRSSVFGVLYSPGRMAGRCQCLIGCRWLGGAAGKNPCGQVPVFYSMHVSTVPQFDGIKQNEVRRDSPDDQLVPIPVARRPMDVSSSQYSCDWQTSEPDFPSATPPTTRSASCGSAIVRPER